jgi:peroxin-5
MAKGKELFDEGQLSQAVLALEVELQRNPTNSRCWHLLGQAHAENDQDSKAIEALSKAVETDSKNGDARMALAVSFTNDLYKENALGCLMEWINNNPQFQHFYRPFENKQGNFSDYHNHVTDIFLAAARQNPQKPDPDVQTGLGLLFNLSVEYEKAADCFRVALASRPNDYLLWNKLGATLANSSTAPKEFLDPAQAKDYSIRCSREALGCYFNALKVKPSYVRARSNLAISYMLLEDYPNAVRQFLTALTMHPEATHMWINLESTLIKYGRNDLIGLAEKHDVELFRGVIDW